MASFQKVYFETNATMTLGSLASTRTYPPLPARFDTNAWTVKPSSGFHFPNAFKSACEPAKFWSYAESGCADGVFNHVLQAFLLSKNEPN